MSYRLLASTIIILLHSKDHTDQQFMSISKAKGPEDYHKRSWYYRRFVLRWPCGLSAFFFFFALKQIKEDNLGYTKMHKEQ